MRRMPSGYDDCLPGNTSKRLSIALRKGLTRTIDANVGSSIIFATTLSSLFLNNFNKLFKRASLSEFIKTNSFFSLSLPVSFPLFFNVVTNIQSIYTTQTNCWVRVRWLLFFLASGIGFLLPYMTIHMKSLGIIVSEEIRIIYGVVPFCAIFAPLAMGMIADKLGWQG